MYFVALGFRRRLCWTISMTDFRQREGRAGVENGDLLKLVDGVFDVMVLADKNLRYQQNLASRRIAFVELPRNRWPIGARV